jgi:ubiquinone/menaquinone biosynthesis C-methylase UbiE
MNGDYPSFYSDPQRYDLVMGPYASGDQHTFYRHQAAHYGEPVLELACGSGRLTVPHQPTEMI